MPPPPSSHEPERAPFLSTVFRIGARRNGIDTGAQ
jgi:hypothetical protein